MTTIFEFQARRIERMAASLAHFMTTTAPDKLDWSPTTDSHSQTRSVMAMVGECVQVNRYVAALLRGETVGRPASPITFADSNDAGQQLIDSGQELAAVVHTLDENALTHLYPHWRGDLPGESLLESPYRNMAYHAGQVNMIQLLTGDTEFHLPPTWL